MAIRIEDKPYCCIIDIVTRRLPLRGSVVFPSIRKKLLLLMEEDQEERLADSFYSDDPKVIAGITKREKARIKEVLSLLAEIKTPSVHNVGIDGSRAIWLIVLHNTDYKNAGKILLQKMKRLYYKDKHSVFYTGIPYLVDMVMLQKKQFDHTAKQLYGTRHWYTRHHNGTGERGSFPVISPRGLAARRQKFGLPPVPRKCKHYP